MQTNLVRILNGSQDILSLLAIPSKMPRPNNSPRPPRYDAAKALFDLSFADPKLGKLIERAGPFTMRVASAQSPVEALVESIIYQQSRSHYPPPHDSCQPSKSSSPSTILRKRNRQPYRNSPVED